MNVIELNPTRMMRLPEVMRVTGLSRPTIYRHMKAGTFPQRVKLTERTSAWVASEVNSWLESRLVQREFSEAA